MRFIQDESVTPRAVFRGLLAALVGPFLLAAFFAILQSHHIWSPKILSSGQIYSPAIEMDRDWYSNPRSHWTLLVLSADPDALCVQKWKALPDFFPSSPLVVEARDPKNLSPTVLQNLQDPLSFSLDNPGTLFLEDPRGFIAMSFSSDVIVQDVFQDLKKILPKHPIRRAS